MKKFYFLFFLFASIQINGQSDTSDVEESMMFINYNILPKYKYGDNQELMEDIYCRLGLQRDTIRTKYSRWILLTFVVDEFGKVNSPEILRGGYPEIEAQLLTMILEYEFEGGTFRGVPVNFQMNFPFRFDSR